MFELWEEKCAGLMIVNAKTRGLRYCPPALELIHQEGSKALWNERMYY